MTDNATFREEIRVTGSQLVDTVKGLVREGNARRIIIRNEEGKTLLEIPLTFAGLGALLLPTIAALGALAALVTNCTIVVVKKEAPDTTAGDET